MSVLSQIVNKWFKKTKPKEGSTKMSKIDNQLKAETLALHGGQEADPTTGSRAGRS